MRRTYVEAIVAAIAAEMRSDDRVFMIGQDIGRFGGPMSGSKGLFEEFGPRRIREAPISESAMVGSAIGAAMYGQRPIVEISFGEFLPLAMSQIVLQAANVHYMTAGEASVPVVIRSRLGDGPYRGHPQSYEAWFPHVPGLKVVMPAMARDAGRLMRAAIRDPNPVLFLENMQCYHAVREEVPDEDDPLPIGTARVVREGGSVTVVATGWLVHRALAAAERLVSDGISVEVIDVRCLAPLDLATIVRSLRKTSHLVIAHEAWKVGGFGAEISAQIAETALDALDAPIARVGAPGIPVPSARPLRERFIPNEDDVIAAIHKVMAY
ncbi:MAG TPA: pyruvate dehydrogenase complex E1 component subunit beta [Chloroflexota bacterium]|nr:pyruvate dehydrogenase complex E1 component subunit beta [Chloroflexota bacterium]